MKKSKIKPIYALYVMQVLLMIGCLIIDINASSEPVPSNYIDIEEICRPNEGLPCGEVLLVRGNVVIIREKISHSCWAKRNLSLFNKDIISTQENGRMRFGFIDGSLVTLASMTELEITRNIYDRAAKVRSLFFNMHSGKARFLVYKLDDLQFSEAKVKTNTAIVVATGSDFFIEGTDRFTKVIALEDTRLEIISVAAPEAEPTVLMDYEEVIVEKDALPSEVKTVPQEEIERIRKEFKFEEMVSAPEGVIKCEDVFFSEDKLVEPEGLVKPGKVELGAIESIKPVEDQWISNNELAKEISEDIEKIPIDEHETDTREDLPEFPGHP